MEQNSLGVITDKETPFGRVLGKVLFIAILIALFWSPLWFGTPQHAALQRTIMENTGKFFQETATLSDLFSSLYVGLLYVSYPNKYLEYFLFFIGVLAVMSLILKCRVMSKNHSVTYVGLGWSFLMMAVMASGKMSKVPTDPWNGALFILYGAFFYAAAVSFLTRQRREMVAFVICLSIFFVAHNAFFQFFGGLEQTRELYAQQKGFETFVSYTNAWFKVGHNTCDKFTFYRLLSDRVSSTFTSPNILASYCMIVALLGLGLLKSDGKRIVKAIGLLATSLALAILFLTRSKSVIALTFALVMIWSFVLYRAKELSLSYLIGVFILGSVFMTVNFMWGYGLGLKNKLVSSGGARLEYWKTALSMIRQKALTGLGADSFSRYHTGEEGALFAHNAILQMWAEYGIFAGLGWLLACALPITTGWDSFKAAAKKDALHLSCILASGGFFIHNMLDFDFYVPGVTLAALAVMALSLCGYVDQLKTQE